MHVDAEGDAETSNERGERGKQMLEKYETRQ